MVSILKNTGLNLFSRGKEDLPLKLINRCFNLFANLFAPCASLLLYVFVSVARSITDILSNL